MKVCNKCGINKKNAEYQKHSRTADGLFSMCKECLSDSHSAGMKRAKEAGAKPSKNSMKPPTLSEVKEYINSKGIEGVIAEKFFNHYDSIAESGAWVDVYGNKIKNWKGKIRQWARRSKEMSAEVQKHTETKQAQKDNASFQARANFETIKEHRDEIMELRARLAALSRIMIEDSKSVDKLRSDAISMFRYLDDKMESITLSGLVVKWLKSSFPTFIRCHTALYDLYAFARETRVDIKFKKARKENCIMGKLGYYEKEITTVGELLDSVIGLDRDSEIVCVKHYKDGYEDTDWKLAVEYVEPYSRESARLQVRIVK